MYAAEAGYTKKDKDGKTALQLAIESDNSDQELQDLLSDREEKPITLENKVEL